MAASTSKTIVRVLSTSRIYKDYERIFGDVTGLPLALRSAEVWNAALRGKPHENPFCALMAQSSRACASCLDVQQRLSNSSRTKSVLCFAGLCDTVVPVRLGKGPLGFLQTGQVAFQKPSRSKFSRIARQLVDWGVKVDLKKLEESYFHTRVLSQKQYQSMVKLLEIFAQHLSEVANQVAVRQENSESPMIRRAREFIEEHKVDDLSLGEVAKVVNVSTFYFCKMFKKATGLNFTDYLSRVRIEKAKNLLLNPHLRISEIAYEVGFQSLSHFNRIFRRVVGRSPSRYRHALPSL